MHAKVRTLLLLAAAFLGLSYSVIQPTDPDLGWHLLGGAWILDHGMVPRADFVNSFGGMWHDYHWLAQIVLFSIYEFGGYDLLRWTLGLFVATFMVVLVGLATKRSNRPGSLVAAGFALYFLSTITSVRPQLFSLFVIALGLVVIKARPRFEIPILFSFAVILANVHVYWIFIPLLWLLYRIVPRVQLRRRASGIPYAWLGLLLLCSAGFVSPYSFDTGNWSTDVALQNYALIWDYLGIPEVLYRSVGEFRSPLAYRGALPWVLLVLVVILARTVPSRSRMFAKLPDVIGLALSLALSLHGTKYLGLLATIGLPGMVLFCSRIKIVLRAASLQRLSKLALGFVLLTALLRNPLTVPLALDGIPIDACASVLTSRLPTDKARDHQRVLTHFDSGGWCRWEWYRQNPGRDLRVTTDNRTQGVPGGFYRTAFDLMSVRNDWAETILQWNPDAAVVPRAMPLASVLLLLRTSWKLVYEDSFYLAFVRIPTPTTKP